MSFSGQHRSPDCLQRLRRPQGERRGQKSLEGGQPPTLGEAERGIKFGLVDRNSSVPLAAGIWSHRDCRDLDDGTLQAGEAIRGRRSYRLLATLCTGHERYVEKFTNVSPFLA